MNEASNALARLDDHQLEVLRDTMPRALAVSGLATKGSTYYNSAKEQRALVDGCVRDLMQVDRGLAAATAVLPGVKDFWRGSVAAALLKARPNGAALLAGTEEMKALRAVFDGLPPHRMLNLCGALRATRVNNARARRLIVGTILDSPRLELWAVKYRDKIRRALEHAWGKRWTTWFVANLSESTNRLPGGRELDAGAMEILRYVFRRDFDPTLPLLSAVAAAPDDFEALRRLPFEVAKGLWSRHHSDRPFADVMERTARSMTSTQRQRVQRQAERHEVVVEWDPNRRPAADLYAYVFERGQTPEIVRALDRKAIEAARRLGAGYRRVGVVVDTSASMLGGREQKNRPLATAYALRDALIRSAADEAIVRTTGDSEDERQHRRFAAPKGSSNLAEPFLEVLRAGPEVVFVITDGYENAPAGRFGEVLHRARQMGVEIPVFQVSTVAAAESRSVRRLSRNVQVLALSEAKGISTALLAETFRTDPAAGVRQLLGLARAELGLGERPTAPLLQNVADSRVESPTVVQYRVGRHTFRGVIVGPATESPDNPSDRVRIRKTHRLDGEDWVPVTSADTIVRRQTSVEVL